MSTNHTRNYALSQWEASDQVVRADFNADNAKLEAALSEAREELDRLRENVFDLAYYVGAENIWDGRNDKYSRRLFPVFSTSFSGSPSLFECTGGVTIGSDRVTLSGQGATGSISTTRSLFVPINRKGKSVRLWIHFNNGAVKPFLNGVEMKREAFFWDSSPVGGYMGCTMFSLDAPYTTQFTLKLEMACGASNSMEIFDVVMAQL